jgi:hypothetical protein
VHQTSVDRYVYLNKDVWRVVCARCGVLADDLGRYTATQVESVMAMRNCSRIGDTSGHGRFSWSGSEGRSLSDEQALAAWSAGLQWSAADAATGAA